MRDFTLLGRESFTVVAYSHNSNQVRKNDQPRQLYMGDPEGRRDLRRGQAAVGNHRHERQGDRADAEHQPRHAVGQMPPQPGGLPAPVRSDPVEGATQAGGPEGSAAEEAAARSDRTNPAVLARRDSAVIPAILGADEGSDQTYQGSHRFTAPARVLFLSNKPRRRADPIRLHIASPTWEGVLP